MKMAKVVRIAKREKQVDLWQQYDDDKGYTGPQWLSVSGAVYNLEGMPIITSEEAFQKIFDIKKDKCTVRIGDLPNTVDFSVWQKEQKQAEPVKMTIGVENDVIRLFQYNGGSLFVRQTYLEPFDDKEEIMYNVRQTADGTPYLCVQDGLILGAIIMPYKVSYAGKKQMKDVLGGAVRELERSLATDRLNAKA